MLGCPENETIWRLGPSPLATHPPTDLPLHADNSAPAALAAILLHKWEATTRPAPTSAYRAARPQVLALLAKFSQSLLLDAPINIDAEDVRSVLRRVITVGLGTAIAHGAGRPGPGRHCPKVNSNTTKKRTAETDSPFSLIVHEIREIRANPWS